MPKPIADTSSHSTTGSTYEILPKDGVRTIGHVRSPIVVAVNAVSVTSVTLSDATKSIATGATYYILAAIAPTNALDKRVTWTSATPAKATVNAAGGVTGVAIGTSVITATSTDDNTKLATCTVTVI